MFMDIVISHLGCNIIKSEPMYGFFLRPSPEMLWPDVAIFEKVFSLYLGNIKQEGGSDGKNQNSSSLMLASA